MTATHKKYIAWLLDVIMQGEDACKIDDSVFIPALYSKLWEKLYSRSFLVLRDTDEREVRNALHLRIEFQQDCDISESLFNREFGERDATVLEIMVTLSRSCKRTSGVDSVIWFYKMLDSMCLDIMDDTHFHDCYVDDRIDIFVNREFKRDGSGGIFKLNETTKDAKKMDLWVIACRAMNEYLGLV